MQDLVSALSRIEDVDSDTLRSLGKAIYDELNHRIRKEQTLRAVAVVAGEHGKLTNIKPKSMGGVRGTIERLSADSRWAYFKPDSLYGIVRGVDYSTGLIKIPRSTFVADEVTG